SDDIASPVPCSTRELGQVTKATPDVSDQFLKLSWRKLKKLSRIRSGFAQYSAKVKSDWCKFWIIKQFAVEIFCQWNNIGRTAACSKAQAALKVTWMLSCSARRSCPPPPSSLHRHTTEMIVQPNIEVK